MFQYLYLFYIAIIESTAMKLWLLFVAIVVFAMIKYPRKDWYDD
jgi:hypothetical protein